MLTLTRRRGEAIQIGKDVFVIIKKTFPGRVMLGIKAPKDTKILRYELDEKTKLDHVR